jgi:hypothetical protein
VRLFPIRSASERAALCAPRPRRAAWSPSEPTASSLPREERPEIQPPTGEHVEAVYRLLAPAYRLPLLVLDSTGMRVGELQALTWRTWTSRVAAGVSPRPWRRPAGPGGFPCHPFSSRPLRGLWLATTVWPTSMFSRSSALTGSTPRSPAAVGRLAYPSSRRMTFATDALAAPPGWIPWATIGQHVGQRDLAVTANTYSHVLTDETKLDLAALIGGHNSSSGAYPDAYPKPEKPAVCRTVRSRVRPSSENRRELHSRRQATSSVGGALGCRFGTLTMAVRAPNLVAFYLVNLKSAVRGAPSPRSNLKVLHEPPYALGDFQFH